MFTPALIAAKRKAIESLYDGLCTITGSDEVEDEVTKLTKQKDVVLATDEPCRLSYKTITAANQTPTVNNIAQVIKLFIRPELNIPPGSKIEVTQYGRTVAYESSGQPAHYSSHQEIVLELMEKHP